jgi:hypothetical protein
MTKQQLINKIESDITKYCPSSKHYETGRLDEADELLKLVEQLDEPSAEPREVWKENREIVKIVIGEIAATIRVAATNATQLHHPVRASISTKRVFRILSEAERFFLDFLAKEEEKAK